LRRKNTRSFDKELLKKHKNINDEQKAEAELAEKQRIASNNQQHFVHQAKKRTQLANHRSQ
jgi:hypothetical protein